MIFRCRHCGFEGHCYGTPTDRGVSAPWCSRCERNDGLEVVEEPGREEDKRLFRTLYGREPGDKDCTEETERKMFRDSVEEIERLRQWVADLQDGMYVNCIYCGHRYEPGTPESRDKHLYEHIRTCPKHPLSKALERIRELEQICGNG